MKDPQTKIDMSSCILAQGVKILSKKWVPHIFCHLLDQEVMSFSEFFTGLNEKFEGGITSSVLSQTLKLLENENLINKRILTTFSPPKTEYFLTNKGRELHLIYGFLKIWSLKWFKLEQKGKSENICCSLDIIPEIKNKIELIVEKNE